MLGEGRYSAKGARSKPRPDVGSYGGTGAEPSRRRGGRGWPRSWRSVKPGRRRYRPLGHGVEGLYREARRWDDLADTYEAHLETAVDPADKLRMLTALGDLRGDELGLPQGALDAYREALEIDFSYRPARLALERLLESKDNVTQREAAEVLEPVFEAEGDHQRLLKVIEIQTESAEDPIKKIALLQKSADIAENVLDNPERTLVYVTRALREGAGHVDLSVWLDRLERVASATSRRAEQVALLREIVVNIFEGQVQFDVTQRIAELARDYLKRPRFGPRILREGPGAAAGRACAHAGAGGDLRGRGDHAKPARYPRAPRGRDHGRGGAHGAHAAPRRVAA